MSDYTLPPLHPLYVHEKDMERVKQWGQHCAEAARAPLLERLRGVCQTLVSAVGADGPCNAEDAAAKAVARIAELSGATQADDERLRTAAARVGITAGCDAADWMADEIERNRARIAELESKLQLERHSLLWACNVYMVPDEAEGADRAQRAVVAASRVRESVSKSLDLRRKKEIGDA